MTHIINGHRRAGEDALLRAMFSERKRVFVDLLGWDIPVLDGRFEIDQFEGLLQIVRRMPAIRGLLLHAALDDAFEGSRDASAIADDYLVSTGPAWVRHVQHMPSQPPR